MVNLVKVGFLGRLGSIGGNLLSPIFGPLITTLVNMFGGDSAGAAIRNSTATMRVYDSVAGSILKDVAIDDHRPEGHRVVENLASGTDTPATQNITVVSGNQYQVTIGKASASGSTAVCSGAFTGTLTGDGVNRIAITATGTPVTATTTTLTVTITGSVKELMVEDVTGYAP